MTLYLIRGVMFSCWEGKKNVRQELLNIIKNNVSTQSKVDFIRHLWYNHKWNYNEVE